jgi:hypothetical protein
MLFLLVPVKDYLVRLAEPRSLVDIVLVAGRRLAS